MYRIVKKAKGYIVEHQVIKPFSCGLKKEWQPFIKTTGLDTPWHHQTFDNAMMNLLREVEIQTIKNSQE